MPLTATLSNRFDPVSVVVPIPILDTPTTSRPSYDGSGISIWGLIYPLPAAAILKIKVPPTPTVAVIFAPVPPPPPAPTLTVIESVVTAVILKKTPAAGSVARG